MSRVRVRGVIRVEPEHVCVVVVPQGEHKDHALFQRGAHARHAAVGGENIDVAEEFFLRLAELRCDRVTRISGVGRLGVGDDDTVLDIEAFDFRQGACVRVVVCQELGHHRDRAVRVDCKAWPVEGLVPLTVGVEVAAIGVAGAAVAVVAIGPTA